MFKQLGEQDATFLYLETPETPQHVGNVSLVELPLGYEGDFYENYKRQIADRMHLIPLLYLKLVQLPFDLDHPFWVEDDNVDMNYHIRHQTVPRPGRMSQLEELIGRLHSNFLDRSRPLWEFYVIDGLESGRVAIYTKIHHAAMDGASSMVLINTMYDPTPEPRAFPPPARTRAGQAKFNIEAMLRGVAGHVVRQEARALQYVPHALKALAKLVLPDAQTLRSERGMPKLTRTPKMMFNVAISSQRTFAARTLALSRTKRLAKKVDAKINDVVLALCAGALRRFLLDKGALPDKPMTAMVPVSMHNPSDPATGNQNGAILCTLATHIDDPYVRLTVIRDAMASQKRYFSNIKNALLPDLSFIGSGALMHGLLDIYRRAKLADRLPNWFNLVVSNVPGPPTPLYIAGARILTMYPCSIPFHGSAVNITVESYCDSLDFGLVACRSTVPDLDGLADLLPEMLTELERAVEAKGTVSAAATRPAARAPKAAALPKPVASGKRVSSASKATGAKVAKSTMPIAAPAPAAVPAPSTSKSKSMASARPRRTGRATSKPTGDTRSTS